MESPVRICLGAALVVNLLLLNGITVNGNTLPRDTTSTTTREERIPTRTRSKTPDASLNELNSKIKPKVSTSEENAKYKDRGRGNVKFHSQIRATTEGSRQRARTEPPHIIIVTPTPEVKKPADIVDSMRIYKKTKLPNLVSSTTPVTVTEEEYEDDISQDDDYGSEENDSIESDEKYTAGFDKYFTMPSFGFNHDNEFGSSSKKVKEEFNVPSYGGFSSVFPHKVSYGYAEPTHDSFKAEYFNYHGELTTPTNDFFDKKYYQVSSSIIKNLDAIKAKTAPPNATDVQKIMKHDLDMKKLSNSSLPGNKSTVFIKNTKEIRLLDNDDANSANKELSDVHGTSIYYEMSVLSTETYAINSDVDCDDNDTLSSGTTPSTIVEESESINTAQKVLPENTTPVYPEPSPESLSTVSSNYLPVSSVLPVYNTINPVAVSTQNSVSSTEKTRIFTSNFSRNWNYSKRLNLNGNRDSPNSVTTKPVIISSSLSPRYQTRKFYHSTPKSKPVWMVPRRNITRIRPTVSSPIYSEHFSINPRTTARPRLSSPFFNRLANNVLTTVSSDIDPVLQGDIGGLKKVVQSQSISDNTVPNLSKRGSTKFGTSATSATDAESEMPPTAWALASLRVPPPSPDPAVNSTVSQKNVDENELQNVGEGIDKKETATDSTASTSANPISNDIIPKKINEVVQNKFEWQAMIVPTSSAETQTETQPPKILSNKSDQSNLSAQNSVEEESFTTKVSKITEETTETFWVPVDKEDDTTDRNYIEKETIPPVDATKSTGFESITKLPADITTPQDESVASSEVNQTITDEKPKRKVPTDYEITTIRFSYVPNEEVTTSGIESDPTETIVPSTWHPVFPTRTRITTLKDTPITTYRPKYTSAEMEDETTTTFIDTTSQIEVSSQVLESATKILDETTEMPTQTTELPTESTIMIQESTITQKESTITQKEGSITQKESTITQKESTITQKETTPPIADEFTTQSTIVEFTTESATTLPEMATTREVPTTFTPEYEDITTTSAEVKTEINTKKEEIILTATDKSSETTEMSSSEPQSDFTEESSGSNEVITQETVKPSTTESPTTKSIPMTMRTTTEVPVQLSTEIIRQTTTQRNAQMFDTTVSDTAVGTEYTTQVGNALEELTSYATEMTTESSSRVLGDDDPGSGAAVAIAVSTIGVIALILLIGLLLVVRRRGRRGVYAQRCTPVSLDAYSLDSVSVGHRKGNQRLRASKRSYGNPAYDDEVTSHPMKYAALANFALDVESMTAEFAEIPSVTVRPDEVPPGCEDKNRYSNVLPLPETRVPLKRIGNDPTTEYINANYVSGPGNIKNYYIACQAPMANTVTDFWRMIWEQNSRLVIMLTEYMENGVEKCYEYLPPSEISDNKRTFGDYRIILKKREQRDKYALSTILLINLATRTSRDIVHLWYFWPAKGVPDDYDSVIDFLCEMRSYMKIMQTAKEYDEEGVAVIYGDQNSSSVQNLSKLKSEENTSNNGVNMYSPAKAEEQMRRVTNNNGTLGRMKAASEVEGIRPCVVLCASGAGRAAALIALDICARALPGAADVPRVVRHLRAQRPHSLTNKHHYIFVYKVLSEYGNKMLGGGVDTI